MGFAQQKVCCPLSAVGAVYDRAFVPLDCENCAVIDRAYSKKVCVCVLLCKAAVMQGGAFAFLRLLCKAPTGYLARWSTRADPEGSPVAVRRVNVTVLASVSSPFHEIAAGGVFWLPPPPPPPLLL